MQPAPSPLSLPSGFAFRADRSRLRPFEVAFRATPVGATDARTRSPRSSRQRGRLHRAVLAAAAAAALIAAALLLPRPAHGATPTRDVAATAGQATIDALTRARESVVGVEVTATEGAASSASLGGRRSGSGVVIGADSLVLTIGYLLLEAESVQVTTSGGRTVPARLVAYDLATGFGLVQPLLPLKGVQTAPLGSSAETKTGEPLMAAVGGEDGGVAVTRLVGQRPFSGYWEYHIEQALFTSPPFGNHSGAPLFNAKGELLGIGSLFVSDAAGGGGPLAPGNMFVPVDLLKPILAELRASGSTRQSRRPWLGLTSAEQAGAVRVVRVNEDGPADRAGVRPGDRVVAVDGEPVAGLETFYKRVWSRATPDEEVRLTVESPRGERREVTVRAVDRMNTLRKPAGI